MCDKLEQEKFMSALCEAQSLVQKLGGGKDVRPQLGIRTAYRLICCWCGSNERKAFSHNRVRDCWYGREEISISAEEMEILRAADRSKRKLLEQHAIEREKQEAKERDAFQELRERITILESRLEKIDPEFFGHALKAFRDAAPRNRRATD